MSLTVDEGSVVVTSNPNAVADPVTVQPAETTEVYAAFQESVVSSGLASIVFEAFQDVVNRDNPLLTFLPWPDKYATTTPPWGQPFDPVAGYPERKAEGERWTDVINSIAAGRLGRLQDLGETALAIASGIKSVLESTFRTGVAQLDLGVSPVITVTPGLTPTSVILLSCKTHFNPGFLRAANRTATTFQILSSSNTDDSQVDWLVVG